MFFYKIATNYTVDWAVLLAKLLLHALYTVKNVGQKLPNFLTNVGRVFNNLKSWAKNNQLSWVNNCLN